MYSVRVQVKKVKVIAELSCARSGAQWVRKFIYPCFREILVVTWPYGRSSALLACRAKSVLPNLWLLLVNI